MQFPAAGDTFAGRFHLERELGAGGFSVVFLAATPEGRRVALKVLRPGPDGTYDRSTRARVEREAAVLSGLRSPHTVHLLESGEADGLLYIAFEHVGGTDLSRYLSSVGQLPVEEAVDLVCQILESLAEAHRAGLVHRDIKPENIRVERDENGRLRAMLLDFGIARSTDDGHPSVTKTGELIGTPRYMSPEQLRAQPITPASDIYSLGLVLFEMLLGRDALPGNRWTDQLDRLHSGHLFAAPDAAGTDAHAFRVVQRMTAVGPEDRFGSAEAVITALRPERPAARLTTSSTSRPSATTLVAFLVIVALVIAAVAALVGRSNRDTERPDIRRTATSANAVVQKAVPPNTTSPLATDAIAVPETPDVGVVAPLPPDRSAGCGLPELGVLDDLPELEVRIPPRYDPEHGYPLVLAFHTDHVPPEVWLDTPEMRRLYEVHGAVVAAPYRLRPRLGDPSPYRMAWDERSDNRELAKAAYDAVTLELCINRTRVFALGHGDGAQAAGQFGCSKWVTASALYGYWLGIPEEGDTKMLPCEGEKPGPVIWLHAMDSGHVPRRDGPACTGAPRAGVARTEALLRRQSGCTGDARTWGDAEGATCATYDCERDLVFCRVSGGVVWPGTRHPVIADELRCRTERPTRFPLSDEIWRFFEAADPLDNPQPPQ